MTLEQAKTLAAQYSASQPLVEEEEEPAVEEEFDEVESEDRMPSSEHVTDVGSDDDDAPRGEGEEAEAGERDGGEREGGERDGVRRRRRRRGRGGGRGEGRDGEPRGGGRERAPVEAGQSPLEPSAEQPGQPGAYFEPYDDAAPAEGGAPSPQNGGEAHGEANGDAEHRRRRRGRRGGRRNRRDRDDAAPREHGNGSSPEHAAAQDRQPGWPEERPYAASAEQPQAAPDIATETYAPRIERPQPEAPAPIAETAAPPPAAAPRRRSTVREPAPVFGESAPVIEAIPATPPPPPPEPVVTTAGADDTGKPRRTGWWAKRLLGGDKG